jgi:RNA polymerase primary sigma factor
MFRDMTGLLDAQAMLVDNGERKAGAEPQQLRLSAADREARTSGTLVSDPISLYFHEIAQEPLLNREQEIRLAQRMESGGRSAQRLTTKEMSGEEQTDLEGRVAAGDAARDHFIRANTRLVVSIAKKYRGYGVPLLDLIQEGNLGLMKAVQRFDYRCGTRFSTYATWWIRQAVVRALSLHGRVIRIPAQMSQRIHRFHKTYEHMEQELGRRVSPEEIADEMGLELDQVHLMIRASRRPLSLDWPVDDEDDSRLGDLIGDDGIESPEQLVEQQLLREQLERVLDTLTPRQARILRLRFGLQGQRPHTLQEIAQVFGLTRERIRQIERQALQRLRLPVRARLLRDCL